MILGALKAIGLRGPDSFSQPTRRREQMQLDSLRD